MIERGGINYPPEAVPYIMDFFGRRALKELGYTDSLDDLDVLTAEAFGIIASEMAAAQERAWKKTHGSK